jgi:DNA-binding beta-propeller fold protein YncE
MNRKLPFFILLLCASELFISCGRNGRSAAPETTTPDKIARDELFIANSATGAVLVFDSLSNGEASPRRVFGNNTGLNGPQIFVDTINNEIVAFNQYNDTITVYPRNAFGNAAPLRIISGSKTGLAAQRFSLAVDAVHNEIFLTGPKTIDVFERTAGGNVEPLRSITNSLANETIAVDATHNELFVSDIDSKTISIFSRAATGKATPMRVINYEFMGKIRSLFLDLSNDELWVGSDKAVFVFPRSANGEVAPLRVLSGDATELNAVEKITVDPFANETIVGSKNKIGFYARTANGNTPPLRTMATDSAEIALDLSHAELFLAHSHSISAYPRFAGNYETPLRILGSEIIDGLEGLAVDSAHREVFLTSYRNHAIVVYPMDADESTSPIRIISGNSTALSYPTKIAVDASKNEVYVFNNGYAYGYDYGMYITVYPRTAENNAAPLRTMAIDAPRALFDMAVDKVNNEIICLQFNQIYGSGGPTDYIDFYIDVIEATANGRIPPLRSKLIGNAASFNKVISVESAYDEVYLANGNYIIVYSRSGDKLREIAADNTFSVQGIAVDSARSEIFITNHYFRGDAINVYPRMASGKTVPLRSISRPLGLNYPGEIVFVKR